MEESGRITTAGGYGACARRDDGGVYSSFVARISLRSIRATLSYSSPCGFGISSVGAICGTGFSGAEPVVTAGGAAA